MEVIRKYFPSLEATQSEQFEALEALYTDWNAKINVISRKDIDHLYERHVLHSLAIAKVNSFKDGTWVLDAGTGGGFPGIPLAILFPETSFYLADSIGKKIKVVKEVAESLGLKNVTAANQRVETIDRRFDFVISRAVTRLPEFYSWVKDKISKNSFNELDNGILYLKGGDLAEEIAGLGQPARSYPVNEFFDEPYFDTKYVVHVPLS
ncbi:16S rRNA m(7)G-527 methyltransferase [Anseongella ginsenosidimutans]|uniref:Ribosomal RNA small subunit methyltransferase G n=1 Tax=Anseongella ginsenosidimutans TaxID=496056 RepID=A0A4R3KW64_9SPHI|nr:16S rRNA (guanine(527)-N(7))-methyltransferase RsmG [Anseongella ginsenosidimutans]QEC53306.1 16S rRNA (guanine(527)-N(7))-methyltransferase RsmG [Anseongella ginsenosidimutans]TCS88181.1 16S rRNA m(7)G-527 methyltransferase [Anseongella ginsenosidimutans]